jgi:hypothetical protein
VPLTRVTRTDYEVSGHCDPAFNGVYTQEPTLLYGKKHFVKTSLDDDSIRHLYWGRMKTRHRNTQNTGQRWLLSAYPSDACFSQCTGCSDADASMTEGRDGTYTTSCAHPLQEGEELGDLLGTQNWREHCSSGSTPFQVIVEKLELEMQRLAEEVDKAAPKRRISASDHDIIRRVAAAKVEETVYHDPQTHDGTYWTDARTHFPTQKIEKKKKDDAEETDLLHPYANAGSGDVCVVASWVNERTDEGGF